MTRRAIATVSAIGYMLLTPLGVSAQPLDLKASPPHGPRERFSGLDSERPPMPYRPTFWLASPPGLESGLDRMSPVL